MTHLGKQILLLYFYPRPPRGGRLANLGEQPVKKKISIHALREEGDVGIHGVSSTSPIFLSTPSARRATFYEGTPLHDGADFYPRPPRGGRRLKLSHKMRFGQ